MNRLDIRNLVIEATGRSDKTSLINSAIDLAVEQVSSEGLWQDLMTQADLSIATDDASVTLPSDFARGAEFRLIIPGSPLMSRAMFIRPKSWVVNYYPYPEGQSTGYPVYGYLEDGQLKFVPRSNGAYTIRTTYFRLHPAMSSDSSTVLIRHASPAVVAWTNYWVFQSTEKYDDAKTWLGTYAIQLKSAQKVDGADSAVKFIAQQRGAEPPRIPEYWLDPFAMRTP